MFGDCWLRRRFVDSCSGTVELCNINNGTHGKHTANTEQTHLRTQVNPLCTYARWWQSSSMTLFIASSNTKIYEYCMYIICTPLYTGQCTLYSVRHTMYVLLKWKMWAERGIYLPMIHSIGTPGITILQYYINLRLIGWNDILLGHIY